MFFDMMLNDAYHIERIRPDDEENAFEGHFREYGKFRIL